MQDIVLEHNHASANKRIVTGSYNIRPTIAIEVADCNAIHTSTGR